MIEVANVRQLKLQNPNWASDDAYVYIGRGSPYGNPFKIGPDGSRNRVIDKYAEYAVNIPHICRAIETMRFADKILVCYCAPSHCHGDFLKMWQEAYIDKIAEAMRDSMELKR